MKCARLGVTMKFLVPVKEIEWVMSGRLESEEEDYMVQSWRKEYGNFRATLSILRWAWFG